MVFFMAFELSGKNDFKNNRANYIFEYSEIKMVFFYYDK